MEKPNKFIPEIKGALRNHVIEVPPIIRECGGIKIFGKRIKSLLFTTDVAIIRNTNADAIIAVYPFTPQPLITKALIMAADVPVFCGVSGGKDTARIVKTIRERYPEFPIIATGGPTLESIKETISKGTNAITYTPPTSAEVMGELMERYRNL